MPEKLLPVVPNVWIYPGDEDSQHIQPNVGVIVAGDQTVLVDAGNSPRHARRILGALDEISAPPVRYVIYTHSHWDHVFGGMALGGTIVGHELCHKLLAEMAAKPWSHSYIQDEIQRSPAREPVLRAISRTIDDWRSFRIALPELTFGQGLRLYLDGLTLDIEHVGGQHSPDSVVVWAKDAGVLFTGDCYAPPPPVQVGDRLDLALMASLLSDEIQIYVSGHGSLLSHADFAGLMNQG